MSRDPLEWERKPKNWLQQGVAPWAGFGVTLKTLFSKPVTEQYPFEKVPPKPRYHGRHRLNRHPDGLEKCVGCELCAWACPADAIFVEAGDNTRALTMSTDYEVAGPQRDELIYDKDQLLAPIDDGMLAAPHPMVEGSADTDYYAGRVTGPSEGQLAWVKAHRPEDPTVATAQPVPPLTEGSPSVVPPASPATASPSAAPPLAPSAGATPTPDRSVRR